MCKDFISDQDFFQLLSYYDVKVEEGSGKVFIQENNEETTVKGILEELIPQITIYLGEQIDFNVNFIKNSEKISGFYKKLKKINILSNELEAHYGEDIIFSNNVQKKYLRDSNNKIYNSKEIKELTCAS